MDYLGPKKYFSQKLVLNQWLLTRFGIDPLADHEDAGKRVAPIERLTKNFENATPGLSANRQHLYLDALLVHYQPSWGYTEAQLKGFDDHIVAPTQAINRRRRDPIQRADTGSGLFSYTGFGEQYIYLLRVRGTRFGESSAFGRYYIIS